MLDLVGNPEDRFSCVVAHIIYGILFLPTNYVFFFMSALVSFGFFTHAQQHMHLHMQTRHISFSLNSETWIDVTYNLLFILLFHCSTKHFSNGKSDMLF